MDSINKSKGYSKISDPAIHRKIRTRMIITSIVVIATVIMAVVLMMRNSNSNRCNRKTESIKAFCSVTKYPESCFSSLESSNKADPEELFRLSLQVSMNEFSKLSSLPQNLIPKVNDPRVKTALRDCQSLFEDAVDQVNHSISSMDLGEKTLTPEKIKDIQTWLSSAMTDQETCLDGLDETSTNLNVKEEMKTAMQNSTNFTANSLAIVSKMPTILEEDLHVPLHRRLLRETKT